MKLVIYECPDCGEILGCTLFRDLSKECFVCEFCLYNGDCSIKPNYKLFQIQPLKCCQKGDLHVS